MLTGKTPQSGLDRAVDAIEDLYGDYDPAFNKLEFTQWVFSTKALAPFVAWYLDRPLSRITKAGKNLVTVPVKPYFEFRNKAEIKENGLFPTKRNPLTPDEYLFSRHYLAMQPECVATIAILNKMLDAYSSKVRAISEAWAMHNTHEYLLSKLHETFSTKVMREELLPVMAQNWIFNETTEPGSANAFRDGLTHAFHIKAMKSYSDNRKKIITCPFSRVLGHIFNMDPAKDENGYLDIKPEPKPGALPAYIYTRIKQENLLIQKNHPSAEV